MLSKDKIQRENNDEVWHQTVDIKIRDLNDFTTITSILKRKDKDDNRVQIEELDSLQLEIETLLVSAVQRQNQIETELELFSNCNDIKFKDKRIELKVEHQPKKNRIDDKSSLKCKDIGFTNKPSFIKAKSKNLKNPDFDFIDPPVIVETVQEPQTKNEVPARFWKFVDSYCASIQSEQIQFLEKLLNESQVDAEYFKIPPLGKHYASKDPVKEENGNTEKSKHNIISKKRKNISSSSPEIKSVKRSKNESGDKCPFGLMTQKLISCLIEENVSTFNCKQSPHESGDKSSPTTCRWNSFSSMNLQDTALLESFVTKELQRQGILDFDDQLNDQVESSRDDMKEDDEILRELKRCQDDLRLVSASNRSQLMHLIECAKKDLIKQELTKKLKEVENELMDAYKKIIHAKQKMRQPTKKDRETSIKFLKERETLIKQIDAL